MATESATYSTQFNTAAPAASDPRSEGDDHLRLIKSVMATDKGAAFNEWSYTRLTATWRSATRVSFGTDQTTVFEPGRRVRAAGSATGTIYGEVTEATYSASTSVNLRWDASSLSNEALQFWVGPSVRSKYRANFDPRQFGAVGDGVTDDTAAVAAMFAAIDAITSTQNSFNDSYLRPKVTIDLQGKFFAVASTVGLGDGNVVGGYGGAIVIQHGGFIALSGFTSSTAVLRLTSSDSVDWTQDITCRDVIVDCNSNADYGIQVRKSVGVRIHNCYVVRYLTYGVYGTTSCFATDIDSCIIQGESTPPTGGVPSSPPTAGVFFSGPDCIVRNSVINKNVYAMQFDSTSKHRVYANHCYGNQYAMYLSTSTGFMQIHGNYFEDPLLSNAGFSGAMIGGNFFSESIKGGCLISKDDGSGHYRGAVITGNHANSDDVFASNGTLTLSATSGSGVTATFSSNNRITVGMIITETGGGSGVASVTAVASKTSATVNISVAFAGTSVGESWEWGRSDLTLSATTGNSVTATFAGGDMYFWSADDDVHVMDGGMILETNGRGRAIILSTASTTSATVQIVEDFSTTAVNANWEYQSAFLAPMSDGSSNHSTSLGTNQDVFINNNVSTAREYTTEQTLREVDVAHSAASTIGRFNRLTHLDAADNAVAMTLGDGPDHGFQKTIICINADNTPNTLAITNHAERDGIVYQMDTVGAYVTLEWDETNSSWMTVRTALLTPESFGSAATVNAKGHSVLTVTGTTGITDVTMNPGQTVTLQFTGILTVTDGGNLKLAGNFSATADDCLTLFCPDGTTKYEVSRSNN